MALPANPIYWKALLLWDPQAKDVVRSTDVQFFLRTDTSFANPQELWDYAGNSLGVTLTSNDLGYCTPFVSAGTTALVVKAGEYVDLVESIQGMRVSVEAARDAALAAAAAAGALAAATQLDIPVGGDTGQVLGKLSGDDQDAGWIDPAGAGHTIRYDGADLPARGALELTGAAVDVADDPTNGRTVVQVNAATPDEVAALSTALAGKAAIGQAPPWIFPTSEGVWPARADSIPAGYTGRVVWCSVDYEAHSRPGDAALKDIHKFRVAG